MNNDKPAPKPSSADFIDEDLRPGVPLMPLAALETLIQEINVAALRMEDPLSRMERMDRSRVRFALRQLLVTAKSAEDVLREHGNRDEAENDDTEIPF